MSMMVTNLINIAMDQLQMSIRDLDNTKLIRNGNLFDYALGIHVNKFSKILNFIKGIEVGNSDLLTHLSISGIDIGETKDRFDIANILAIKLFDIDLKNIKEKSIPNICITTSSEFMLQGIADELKAKTGDKVQLENPYSDEDMAARGIFCQTSVSVDVDASSAPFYPAASFRHINVPVIRNSHLTDLKFCYIKTADNAKLFNYEYSIAFFKELLLIIGTNEDLGNINMSTTLRLEGSRLTLERVMP